MSHALPAVALLLLVAGGLSSAQSLPPLRMVTQQLEITYASPAEAQQAALSFAPVCDNRTWAFSARWDDTNANSLNMHDHMVKYGLKGTFYLTQPDARQHLDADWAKKLQAGGCSVGGHSLTHPAFAEVPAGEVFRQVLANRIEWEDLLDTPLNSFAFPYGQFRDGKVPLLFQVTTETLQRSGYLHCVYSDFVWQNPYLAPGEICTGNQVIPGDRVVDAASFQEQLDKIVTKWPDNYRKLGHNVFLGVHAWQPAEELTKLDAVFETLAHKPDWWYCSQNEWAAYSRQAVQSQLRPGPVNGETVRYTLTRPAVTELGAPVPLTVVVAKAGVRSAKLDGQPIAADARGDLSVLNLPAPQPLPRRIGHIEMAAPPAPAECAKYPGLKCVLVADAAASKITLQITAAPDAPLANVAITFRLPLLHATGLLTKDLRQLAAGASATVELPLPAVRPDASWSQGPKYYAAQVDFSTPTGPGRVWVTTQLP
jgi:peptidoglycan/xylan/chitin deacetylase (PgdA/CDA1 family)